MVSRRIATLSVAVALAAPATAFAQSAGDEQYQDPFGGDQGQSQNSGTPSSSGDQGTSTPTQAPAPTAAQPTATTAQAAPAAAQLPRTGGDPLPVAVAGFWLLLGGVALRARVRVRAR
jgi:hypothetical protein